MKKNVLKLLAASFGVFLLVPASLLAQNDKGDKGDKETKDVQQIIITNKGEKEKMVVVVDGDKITINGKPVDEFKMENGDVSIKVNKFKQLESLSRIPGFRGNWNSGDWKDIEDLGRIFNWSDNENRAMLGVTTEKDEDGAEVEAVTKGSAAEKAGIKEDDVITKVNDTKITSPDDLSKAIQKQKPGDKVSITFLRNKKEQKVTAELTKWEGLRNMNNVMKDFDIKLDGLNFDRMMPRNFTPGQPNGPGMHWSGGSPKLGLSVQDTDDGKGVKVIEVDEESNAEKAGIKEGDIITKLDDKAVNSVDEIAKLLREKKDNPTVTFQLTRNGKLQTIEAKMPRKIRTADL